MAEALEWPKSFSNLPDSSGVLAKSTQLHDLPWRIDDAAIIGKDVPWHHVADSSTRASRARAERFGSIAITFAIRVAGNAAQDVDTCGHFASLSLRQTLTSFNNNGLRILLQ